MVGLDVISVCIQDATVRFIICVNLRRIGGTNGHLISGANIEVLVITNIEVLVIDVN